MYVFNTGVATTGWCSQKDKFGQNSTIRTTTTIIIIIIIIRTTIIIIIIKKGKKEEKTCYKLKRFKKQRQTKLHNILTKKHKNIFFLNTV